MRNFEVNTVPYYEDKADSFTNLIESKDESDKQIHLTMALMRYRRNHSTKQIFKNIFGKQLTTRNYTCRNLIWTFSRKDQILYAWLSVEGLSWGYHKNTKIDRLSLI